MNQPTVSVIIPTYNRAHVLGRAIKSVLDQTFTKLELIVVDDGSSDNTEDVVRSYGDQRISYLKHEQNKGAPAARNTGIRHAAGSYVSFLDSDDEWMPEKLKAQLAIVQSATAPIVVVSGMQTYDDAQHRVINTYLPIHSGHIYEKFFGGGAVGNITMLVPFECFDTVGTYDENLPASQQWDMSVRLAAKYEFLAVPKPMYIVHRGGDGTHVRSEKNRAKAMEYLLQKYAMEYRRHPRWHASTLARLGRLKSRQGQAQAARRDFRISLCLFPYLPRVYLYYLLSLIGH